MSYEKQWEAKKIIKNLYYVQKIKTSKFSNKSLCDEDHCSYND